jgi:uroporphyrinogen decarboxylase
MNSRERILTALRHQEPDRVPIDFGGTVDSTIMAVAYQDLRRHLGLNLSTTRVLDIYQQTAVVEEDVRQALGVDVVPVFNEPREWRAGTLADSSPAELPAKFRPQIQEDGSRLLIDAGGNTIAKMPKGGPYYDPVYTPLANATTVSDVDKHIDDIVTYDTPSHLDKSYEELAQQAKTLRETTDYALVGFFGGHILQAGQVLRGWETFLMDLLVNKTLAHAIMERLLEANLARFEQYAATVGPYLDVVQFEEDLGMQDRPLMRPETFREMLKPYMKQLFSFVKSKCDAYLLLHTDGAVAPLIPDFVEMGVDALNPVQVSAAGMDTKVLKQEFGRDITFWGGGCDTQAVLPFGTPETVADEVRRRIDDLAPGGGFVFTSVHNVQAGVPSANTITMFETAREYGVYKASGSRNDHS